jgi:ribosomal protein S18 acetylase RimI-like enzyme
VTGARIRAANLEDADAVARVHVQTWQETYHGLMPHALLASLSVEQRAAMWKRVIAESAEAPSLWVSEDADGLIVGFGFIGRSRDERLDAGGEVLAINLLERAKRRGLGRELFIHLLALLKQRSFVSAGLWVLTANEPARRFYEAMGGRPGAIRSFDVEGGALDEISYIWDLNQAC